MYYRPKKSLGQHFLKSGSIVKTICDAGNLSVDDTVLEIGPGNGVLTKALLARVQKVLAIEKDDRLYAALAEELHVAITAGALQLVHQDILEVKFAKLPIEGGAYKVVANIPYYITGQLIRKLLSSDCQPSDIVLMVQKEVAERIVAQDGKESVLSLSVKAYGVPRYITTVHKRFFIPHPKVDSAVIAIRNISKDFFTKFSEKAFFTLLHAGFAQKRKTLANALKNLPDSTTALAQAAVDPHSRAEDLPLEIWQRLAVAFEK